MHSCVQDIGWWLHWQTIAQVVRFVDPVLQRRTALIQENTGPDCDGPHPLVEVVTSLAQ